MRWESKVNFAELTPAQTWSKRDEGNFGGRSLLNPDQNELAHYGIPGMKWGIKTKEYVKKGYNTLKRRQAILKQKQKAEAKAQFEEGYRHGQRAASNTSLIKYKVAAILKRKKREQEGSLSDRAVDKGVDLALKKTGLDKEAKKYGLDAYIPQAKEFLKKQKDELADKIVDYMQTENGQQKLQKFTNFMAKGVSTSIGVGTTVVRAAGRGSRILKRAARTGVRKAAKASAASIRSGYKWLREGNPSGAKRIHARVRDAEKILSKYGNAAANAISKGAQRTHQGARSAHKQLGELLSRRRRRS